MEGYYKGARILASVALVLNGFLQMSHGPKDSVSGITIGIALYAIWFARERKAKV